MKPLRKEMNTTSIFSKNAKHWLQCYLQLPRHHDSYIIQKMSVITKDDSTLLNITGGLHNWRRRGIERPIYGRALLRRCSHTPKLFRMLCAYANDSLRYDYRLTNIDWVSSTQYCSEKCVVKNASKQCGPHKVSLNTSETRRSGRERNLRYCLTVHPTIRCLMSWRCEGY